uniref:Uncharacterized protein n=1 Tax=Rhizophora mucronata TaxID=61149 RepID=A0A2P2NUR1_RHIMU
MIMSHLLDQLFH